MSKKAEQLCKICIAVVMLLSLVSCGYKDIDRRMFVVAIGVDKADKEDKKYKVMLKMAIPKTDIKAGQDDFILSEAETNSITEAIRIIKTKVDKDLDFSHAKAIIFGEDILQEDVQQLLDWFIRRRDIQKIAWVGVGRPNAKDILKLKRKIERLPSNSIFLSFGNIGTNTAYIISEYLFDFRKRITEKGLDPILPILEARKEYFVINQAALFDSEQLKLTLDEEETKLLNILLNRATIIDVRVSKDEDENQNFFFIAADAANVNYRIITELNKPVVIKLDVNLEGIVEESLEELPKDKIEEYTTLAEKQMKKRMLELLIKLQGERLDPIGFGLHYRATHFNDNEWETWQQLYNDVEFRINISLEIQGTGLLNN